MKNVIVVLMIFSLFACSKSADKARNLVTGGDSKNLSVLQEEEYQQKVLDPKEIVSPIQSIKNLDKTVEQYHAGQNLTAEQIVENKKLKFQIIRGTFDIRELCRLSLAEHWHELNESQQNEFVKLMTELLETKAIFSKEQLRGDDKLYHINYSKEVFDDAEKTKSTVKTEMVIPKENLHFEIIYKMLLTPYGWKIYDVVVDDASLLTNYRFQFDRIIKENGFSDLIQRMRDKLTKMQS